MGLTKGSLGVPGDRLSSLLHLLDGGVQGPLGWASLAGLLSRASALAVLAPQHQPDQRGWERRGAAQPLPPPLLSLLPLPSRGWAGQAQPGNAL